MSWHLHKWERWSKPYRVEVHFVEDGRPVGVAPGWYQRRTCAKCGKVKKREAR